MAWKVVSLSKTLEMFKCSLSVTALEGSAQLTVFLLPSCTAWRSRYKVVCTWRLTGDREKKGDSIPQKKAQEVKWNCAAGAIAVLHWQNYLFIFRDLPFFTAFSHTWEWGSQITSKSSQRCACWGIIGTHSGAEGAPCSKSSAHNDLQGIWSAWFFCLCSSSKSARSCWNATPKNISVNSLLLCPFATESCNKIYHVFYWNVIYSNAIPQSIWWASEFEFSSPSVRDDVLTRECLQLLQIQCKQGLEQNYFRKLDCMNLYAINFGLAICRGSTLLVSLLSLLQRKSLGFFQIRAQIPPPLSTQPIQVYSFHQCFQSIPSILQGHIALYHLLNPSDQSSHCKEKANDHQDCKDDDLTRKFRCEWVEKCWAFLAWGWFLLGRCQLLWFQQTCEGVEKVATRSRN